MQKRKAPVGQNARIDVLAGLRHDERAQHALRADVGDGLWIEHLKAGQKRGERFAGACGQAPGCYGAAAAQSVERLCENGVVDRFGYEVLAVLFLGQAGRDAEHGARRADHDHRGKPGRRDPGAQPARAEKRERGPGLEPGSKRSSGCAKLPGNGGRGRS